MKITILLFLTLLWFGSYGQTRFIQFVDEQAEEVPFVLVKLNEAVMYADANGQISLEALEGQTLGFEAFSYQDSSITVGDQDTIKVQLNKESFMLEEVTVNDQLTESSAIYIKSHRLFSNPKDYQREPGECFLVQLSCNSCRPFALEVEVSEVFKKNVGLRMVVFYQDQQIASGIPVQLAEGFKGKTKLYLSRALQFDMDSIRIGVEFIHASDQPSHNTKLVSSFSVRGNKGLYTRKSNGLSLAGFKVREAENPYYLLSYLRGEKFFFKLSNGQFSYAPKMTILMY